MGSIEVKVVELGRRICASFYSYGESPEEMTFEKVRSWAGPKGLLDDPEKHPTYGFDNPVPAEHDVDSGSPSKEYGYEILVCLDERVSPEGDMRIVNFPGGLYAVAHMPDFTQHAEVWTHLWEWADTNGYRVPATPQLESHLSWNDPSRALVMDLHLPIVKDLSD